MSKSHEIQGTKIISRFGFALILGSLSPQLQAFELPSGIFAEDDTLFWTTEAPSTNIYEDGAYIATVHGGTSFEPIFEGSVYQLVAHDHGAEFTGLSLPFLYEDDDSDDDTDDEDSIEFDEARLYFELNDTDNDLGLHALVDGESWRSMSIEDRTGRTMFEVEVSQGLLAQGMTEIFFESSEPNFSDLDPADFFARFPAGEYDIGGVTLDGIELESEVILSHVIPAAPANVMVNGELVPDNCENESGPVVASPLVLSWDPVTSSHATLGSPGDVIVDRYQVVVEREEPSGLKLSFDVNPGVTQLQLPVGLIGSGEDIKIEVLTIADSNNQVANESCFVSAD